MPLSFLACDGSGAAPLNASQYAAVTASDAPQLVLAGPGTGKTRVLTYRAAYLLRRPEAPVAPSELVLVTFTRKAAGQLRRRLAEIVGRDASFVRAGTLHFFAYSLIRRYPDSLGLPPDFVVADDLLLEPFWQGVAREYPGTNLRDLKDGVSRLRLALGTASREALRVKTRYEDWLAERGFVDFDGLLVFARDLLRDHETVRARLQAGCGALLVDEFQDTDPVQFEILRLVMCPTRQGFFAVADDDQSIYGFRGADAQNVRRFQNRYGCAPGMGNQHVLRDNYRSSRNVFAVAESVLDPRDRMKGAGDVVPVGPDGPLVEIVSCQDAARELHWTVERVCTLVKGRHARCADVAILTPRNARNGAFEEALLARGIPCDVSGEHRLTETPVVERLRVFLELLHLLAGEGACQRGARFDALLDAAFLLYADEAALAAFHGFRAACADDAYPSPAALRALASQDFAGAASDATAAATWIVTVLESLTLLLLDPAATVADLVRALLPMLDEPAGLLELEADKLAAPASFPSVAAAAAHLREACRNGARIVVDAPGEVSERLLALVVEAAVDYHAVEGRRATVLGARQLLQQRKAVMLDGGDLVVTSDCARTVSWLARGSLPLDAPSALPSILDLAPENAPPAFPTFRHVPVDAEGHYESPAVRLFKLVQATVPADAGLRDYTVIDLETTGLDTAFCRVVEFGAVRVRAGVEVASFEMKVALPDDLLADEWATLRDVSGFSAEDFQGAPPLDEAFAAFAAFVGSDPIVAYNGALFDFPVLHRLDADMPGCRGWTREHDMLIDARRLLPHLHSHRAEAVSKHLFGDHAPRTAHRALSDCRDQHGLYEALARRDAARKQATGFEPLLAVVAVAMGGEKETSLRHDEERLLFQMGFLWSARGEHPVIARIEKALPKGMGSFEALTHRRAFAHALENLPPSIQQHRATPRTLARIEAVLQPYEERTVASGATSDLVAFLALWNEPQEHLATNVVTISTYHSAKGLEFDHVFCTGVDDSTFPWYRTRTDEEKRESRRVLYVGLTRCKAHLTITHSRQQKGHARRLSTFLDNRPEACVESYSA